MTTPTVQKIDALIDDDVNIIVEVLKKTKAKNVIINIPDGNDLLNSTIGLKLLQKNAVKLGKKIALRVSSESSLNFIQNLHLPVALNDDQAMELLTEEEGHSTVTNALHRKRIQATEKTAKGGNFQLTVEDGVPPPIVHQGHHSETKEGENHSAPPNIEPAPEQPSRHGHHAVGGQSFLGFDFAKGAPAPKKSHAMTISGGSNDSGKNPLPTVPVNNFLAFFSSFQMPFKGLLVKAAIALVLLVTVGFIIYYRYFPKVVIDLTIAAESVQSTDLTISATTDITGFDKDKKQIQLLQETVTNTGSKNIKATGNSVTGNKATGIVKLYNSNTGSDVTIKAGTTLTVSLPSASAGLKFVTNQDVTIPSPGSKEVGVTAAAVGEEYNLPGGSTFTIGVDNVVAQNDANAPFSGGTKSSKTVISQKDVDDNTKDLQKQIAEENKSQLEFKHQGDNFVYVAESVKDTLDGKAKVDPAVGTETGDAYLEIKVKSTALYYQEAALETLVSELLKDQYVQNKGLTDASSFEVTNFKQEIKSIKIEKNGTLTLTVTGSGDMVPKTDVTQLENDIRGRSWEGMLSRLKQVQGQTEEAEVKFNPSWLPKFLYYVPKEEPRVVINIRRVQQ